MPESDFRPTLFERIAIATFRQVNKHVPWFRLPTLIGAMNLASLRVELRGYNLHDGYSDASHQGSPESEPVPDPRYRTVRNSDGKFNSLEQPRMGCTGMRFGRNFPREHCQKPTDESLWTPSPRLVSERFMQRNGAFIPATTLNLLAAAWIQFQTHDWFNHEIVRQTEPYPVTLYADACRLLTTRLIFLYLMEIPGMAKWLYPKQSRMPHWMLPTKRVPGTAT